MRVFLWTFLIPAAALSACGGGGGGGGQQPPPPPPRAEAMLSLLAGASGGAGNADGTGAGASFSRPSGVAIDSASNVYVADNGNAIIREITPEGVVTTIAGTAGMGVGPLSAGNVIAIDSSGNIYGADLVNDIIRKITPAGVVTTLAGTAGMMGSTDGTGAAARFNSPQGVATDSAGNVYVADTNNATIRRITPAGVVTTLAGTAGMYGSTDGTGAAARFNSPQGVATDSAGNVYVADTNNATIRKITPDSVVTTLAGTAGMMGSTDGTGAAARFNSPQGVATDSAGNVYVADTRNDTIRKITPDGVVTTMAGSAAAVGSADGTGAAARFNSPEGVVTDGAGNVYVADTINDTIRKITPDDVVTTMAGSAAAVGSADGTGAAARFYSLQGVATDGSGTIYVADYGNDIIRKITPAGVVTTVAGVAGMQGSTDGTGEGARFSGPTGVALGGAGDVYVADNFNQFGTRINTIRKITPAGVVTTFAGIAGTIGTTDGTGAAARFAGPTGVGLDGAGNVYVSDEFSDPDIGAFGSTIRKITPAGVVTTFAGMAGTNGSTDGTGAAARFYFPQGVATDGAGNVYVADAGNGIIRKITPAGVTTTLAGTAGMTGSTDGVGAAARFNFPQGVATDGAGNVYVADTNNDTIRKITPDGVVTTIVGRPGKEGFLPGPLPGLLRAPTSVTVFGRTLYTTTNNAIVQVSNVP